MTFFFFKSSYTTSFRMVDLAVTSTGHSCPQPWRGSGLTGNWLLPIPRSLNLASFTELVISASCSHVFFFVKQLQQHSKVTERWRERNQVRCKLLKTSHLLSQFY